LDVADPAPDAAFGRYPFCYWKIPPSQRTLDHGRSRSVSLVAGPPRNRATQEGSTPMMNALPTLIVAWAVVTGLFLALLAYNGTITRYEDNQLFLADINANEQQRQSVIVRKVNKTLPYVRALGTLSGILTVIIIGIYTWDSWKQLHQ
jgi:hypothetical protein